MLFFMLLLFGFCLGMDMEAIGLQRQAFERWRQSLAAEQGSGEPNEAGEIHFDDDDEDLDRAFQAQAAKCAEDHIVRNKAAATEAEQDSTK